MVLNRMALLYRYALVFGRQPVQILSGLPAIMEFSEFFSVPVREFKGSTLK